jgi:hypothetical protein
MWVLGMAWLGVAAGGIYSVSQPSPDARILFNTTSPPHRILGWVLVSVASITAAVTMNRWKKIVAGLLAYGALNCFVMIFSGHATNNPRVPVRLPQSIMATVFLIVTSALCFRFTKEELTLLDRIALFVLVWAILLQAARPEFTALALGAAVTILVIARVHDSIHCRSSRKRLLHVS